MNTTACEQHAQLYHIQQQDNDGHRLPCRGCTRDCSNYKHCHGRPWRMQADAAKGQPHLMHTP